MEPFWKELPARLQGRARCHRGGAEAYTEATSLQPPPKVQQKKISEFLQVHAPITDPALLAEYERLVDRAWPPLTYGTIAYQACWLGESLDEIGRIGRQQWAEAWPGDTELSTRSRSTKMRACPMASGVCGTVLKRGPLALIGAFQMPQPARPHIIAATRIRRRMFLRSPAATTLLTVPQPSESVATFTESRSFR